MYQDMYGREKMINKKDTHMKFNDTFKTLYLETGA